MGIKQGLLYNNEFTRHLSCLLVRSCGEASASSYCFRHRWVLTNSNITSDTSGILALTHVNQSCETVFFVRFYYYKKSFQEDRLVTRLISLCIVCQGYNIPPPFPSQGLPPHSPSTQAMNIRSRPSPSIRWPSISSQPWSSSVPALPTSPLPAISPQGRSSTNATSFKVGLKQAISDRWHPNLSFR